MKTKYHLTFTFTGAYSPIDSADTVLLTSPTKIQNSAMRPVMPALGSKKMFEQKNWIHIPSVPPEIHVYDFMGEPRHPFTPDVIRQDKVGTECGIWIEEPYVGIVLGVTEHAWRLEQLRSIEVFFAKPGKGAGYVALGTFSESAGKRGQTITDNKHFDQKHLGWARQVLSGFESIGVATKENDEGYDA